MMMNDDSASHRLEVPPVRLCTVGKRTFPVTGANTLRSTLHLHSPSQSRDLPLILFLTKHHDMTYH